MDVNAIYERLRGQFGEKIKAVVTDNPDPYVTVDKAALAEIARFLKTDAMLAFDYLESISGFDLKDRLQIVYHLASLHHRHVLVVKAEVPYTDATVPSVCEVWAAANWHEREQFDMFGINFTGHPDLRRILLPDDWVGNPLRKDYVYPEQYHGIEHYRPDPKDQLKALDALRAKAQEKHTED